MTEAMNVLMYQFLLLQSVNAPYGSDDSDDSNESDGFPVSTDHRVMFTDETGPPAPGGPGP